MPLAVANCTVTVSVLEADRLTVKAALTVPEFPSVTVTSLIDSVGVTTPSSFRMVPSPWLSAMVALVGMLRFTKNVSFGSTTVSPRTRTVIVLLVSPGLNVSVPENVW